MRWNRWLAVFVLFIAVCAPSALADSYTTRTLDFTLISGSPAPTGSFVLDDSTNTFASFTVNWDGAAFDFGGTSGSAIPLSGYWCGQGPLYISSAACAQEDGTFSFASQLSNGIPSAAYIGANDTVFYTNLSAFAYGSYTTTETTVPAAEPATLALALSGIVLLGVMLAMHKGLHLRQSY